MSNGINPKFGGAVDIALEKVTQSAAESISVADAGTREAFLDAWARTLSEHAKDLRSKTLTLAAPVVIVYVPNTSTFGKQFKWNQRSMLGSSHRDNFAGILAVGTGEVGAYVHPTNLTGIEEFEQEIRDVNLEFSPTIALTTESKLVVWPDGIDSKPSPFDSSLNNEKVIVDLNAIDHHLTYFYEEVGRQTKKWWQNPALRTTVNLPETTVQYELWVYLMGQFGRDARIKKEEIIGSGRADITIVPIHPSTQDQSAVLELKTIRDVHTPKVATTKPAEISLKENIAWALSGIPQTAAYRDDNKMDCAFLCIYDFCAGNTPDVDNAVKPNANHYNIQYRRYWITASHEEHRLDRYPLPK